MATEPTRRDMLRAGGLVAGGVLVSGAIAEAAAAPALAAGGGSATGLGNYISTDPRGAAFTLVAEQISRADRRKRQRLSGSRAGGG